MYDLQPYLNTIEDVIAQGPFKDTWESLSAYQVPDWYQNAKFGIFIHWGVYSVPAFGNEWYPRHMYKQVSPCLKGSALTRRNGWICFSKQGQNT